VIKIEPIYLSDLIQKADRTNNMPELETAIAKVERDYKFDLRPNRDYQTYLVAIGKVYASLANRPQNANRR